MTTTPTKLAVPSEKPQDLKFNAGKIDEFVTSMIHYYIDRFGYTHYTIEGLSWLMQQAIANAGYITIDSFQDGATLTMANQILRWKSPDGDGEYYRWDGTFPKDVLADSTPSSAGGVGTGAWVCVGDAALRSQLASIDGTSYITLPFSGVPAPQLKWALNYLTPEMFQYGGTDSQMIQACARYAKESGLPVHASGTYTLTESVQVESVVWRGGTFRTTEKNIYFSIIDTDIEDVRFDKTYLWMNGGNCRVRKNKFYNQGFTAAFFIQLQSVGSIDCCYNEFYNCKYAILQQASDPLMMRGAISFNVIHDIYGDGIELNVLQKHYPQGLMIEGNLISNVDSDAHPDPDDSGRPNWGIGIGVAGGGHYGVDAPDSDYVANFTIKGNRVSGCRQCIHVEKGRDFSIVSNECYPDSSKSTKAGIANAAVVTYGCKDFTIDGVTGEPVVPGRYILIEWGVNITDGNGVYAGPPRNFTLRNISTRKGKVEVYTAGADDWDNKTDLQNLSCDTLKWRGLPAASYFRNIAVSTLDCIGRHQWDEGSGGGLYERTRYTYSNWQGVVCLNDVVSNVSISKMFCDRIDQGGNNFSITLDEDGPGHRGPRLIPQTEHYRLLDDQFPGGREFSDGTVLHKAGGGYFLITKAGAYIQSEGTYADTIQEAKAGQNYIQGLMNQWITGPTAKAAGTRIIIPGAGVGASDLLTTIVRADYTYEEHYAVEIDPPIATTVPQGTILRAAYPVEYVDVIYTPPELN